jgi:two-component system sensor histidine kinase AlgZ
MDSRSTTDLVPAATVDAQLPAQPEGCPPKSGLASVLEDIGICLAVAAVLTAILVPFWGLRWNRVVQVMITNSVISLGIGLSVSSLYRWVFPPVARRLTGWLGRGLLHLAIAVTAVFGGGEIALRVLGLLGWPADQMRASAFQIGLVVVVVVVGFSFAFERLKQRAREVELREHEARQKTLRARLDALQARTDPHFLFNTLNTVAGLIEEDPRTAEKMLERLSGVFRYALSGSKDSWVRLDDELRAVRDYLAVEQIRFGERLKIRFNAEAGVEHRLVPPLVLQPLVENAVLHGVAPRPGPGLVTVEVTRNKSDLLLRVEDDGPGPGGSLHRGSGTSLDNLRERLALVYGGRASLEAGASEGPGYRATLRLPVEEPSS